MVVPRERERERDDTTNQSFARSDRKADDLFVCKAFLFSQRPCEYLFGVEEKIHDQPQQIDITSDVTGEPHDLAKAEIPMYGRFQKNPFLVALLPADVRTHQLSFH